MAALELVLLVDPLVFPHHRGGGLAYAAVPALVPLVRGMDFQLVPVHVGVLLEHEITRRARVLLHLPVRRFVVDLSKGTYTYDVQIGQGMGYTQFVLIGTGQANWDNIKFWGHVVCPFVCMSVCVYFGKLGH